MEMFATLSPSQIEVRLAELDCYYLNLNPHHLYIRQRFIQEISSTRRIIPPIFMDRKISYRLIMRKLDFGAIKK
jgi:hypothetical protein